MTKTVAIQKCTDYDFEKVFTAVKKLFELCPPPDVKGKTVLLKPNILYPKKPDACVCTHPSIVGATVKAFLEAGAAKVIAGESPAVAGSISSAKSTGIYDAVVSNGGVWADFSHKTVVKCPDGLLVKQFEFADTFNEADIVVSLSKLKSHQLMTYTGAMKNLFGLMVGLDKAQCHYRFPDINDFGKFLTDLNIAAKPQYAIMDAIVGMDGPGGPGSGDPIQLDFLAASDNILALDWKCSELVGYNPYKIPNLNDALSRGIWLTSPEEIITAGEKEDDVRCTTFRIVTATARGFGKSMPGWVNAILTPLLTKTPHFNPRKCIKCGRCQKICPAQIIVMTGKNSTATLVEKSKCLHCFCCHEICSESAISLRIL